jgi:hypothetical protein
VLKWVKRIIAVLLLPFCWGALVALWRLLQGSGNAVTIWVPIVGGAACWGVLFYMLPKPMRLYVFAHELTHALWTLLCGGKVMKFKVGAGGGQVVVTKNNFLIALAPYFFPFYVALVVGVFLVGHWIWGWKPYIVWFHLLVGAAYAFHVTLTWHILQTEQTDITSQGYLFSCVVIFLGNITVLLIGICLLVGNVHLQTLFQWWWWEGTWNVLAGLRGVLGI